MNKIFLLIAISIFNLQLIAQQIKELRIERMDTSGVSKEIAKFKKLELGIELPQHINNEITNFIEFSKLPNSSVLDKNKKGLNPFDPEDINVVANFYYFDNVDAKWNGPFKVYGFYYKDMIRSQKGRSTQWNWESKNTKDALNGQYNFRVRFAPPIEGKWKCSISVKVKGGATFQAADYLFETIPSNNPGYVKVGSNKRFFTLGDETFFPIGRNITQPQCIHPNGRDPYGCDALTVPGNWDNGSNYPSFYLSFLDEITEYHAKGGNYFRLVNFPESFDIEFEKLNNYYDRMNRAWELDKLVEHCENLGVKFQFNLQNHEAFESRGAFTRRFDWVNQQETEDRGCNSFSDDKGYCYHSELNIPTPQEFLTDSLAQKYYKYRLRYMSSRWGYSTAITFVELRSEMNNHANEIYCDERGKYSPYSDLEKYPDFRRNVFLWQQTMCQFLKENQYFPHPTAVGYTGEHLVEMQNGDSSYNSKYVDVATWNFYKGGVNVNKDLYFNYLRLHGQKKVGRVYLADIDKPIVISEMGNGDVQFCSNDVEFFKDSWSTCFTGDATMGINWHYQHRYELASHFANISQFLKGLNFNGGKRGPWKPQFHQREEDKAASSYTLISQEKRKEGVGVIVNNTVNYYTMSDENTPCHQDKPGKEYETNKEVYSKTKAKNKLKLNKLGNHKYTIEWYNGINMEIIGSPVLKKSVFGKLRLDYPTLSADMSQYIIVYKIKRAK